MSDSPSPSTNEKPWSDGLMDSLLQQSATNQGGDDEAFLDAVEAAIDQVEQETVIPLNSPGKGAPSKRSKRPSRKPARPANPTRNLVVRVAGIAAVILFGFGIWFLSQQLKSEKEANFQLAEDPPVESGKTPEFSSLEDQLKEALRNTPASSDSSGEKGELPISKTDQQVVSTDGGKQGSENNTETAPEGTVVIVSEPTPQQKRIAENYVNRLQERVKQADEAALRGSALMTDGDLQGAIDQFVAALDLLPEAPMTEAKLKAYIAQFSKASIQLARERADEGRYPESIFLVENVLQPTMDPLNVEAKRLLEALNDPDYFSPALTPAHLERVRRVKLALKTAQGYMELGDYDRADREFNKALNDDPYNVAARRGMETNERHRMNYYDAAYDATRGKILREVAAGWETPVPVQADGSMQPLASNSSSLIDESRLNDRIIESPNSSINFGAGFSSVDHDAFVSVRHSNFNLGSRPPEATTSRYGELIDNAWQSPLAQPLSTFSIDVDTASMSNVRGLIIKGANRDQIPHDSVRIEELINYFDWDYPQPNSRHPFAFATETAECPWNDDHQLMRVGIQGKEIERSHRPDANLVFLLDVSGSMDKPNKLPLVKQAISVLVEELKEKDSVSIVVYAGSQGLALPATSGADQASITAALDRLDAGGSTNGGAGIKLAYRIAQEQFIKDGVNRVILCTDGDFNVGITGDEDLVSLVEKKAESGIFLSVCGFGFDNLNDAMLEEITNRGNGNYYFIDTFSEARKVFLKDMMGTLVTIAKDVKIQVEFNPGKVAAYRLIGYANRRLKAEDFNNDEIDAGEVGSGHSVTALYEIVPVGADENPALSGELRYQKPAQPETEIVDSDELALLKLRYKKPDSDTSILMSEPVMPDDQSWRRASDDFRFASAVGLFGLILREHESAADSRLDDVINLAGDYHNSDPHGYRGDFIKMVRALIRHDKKREDPFGGG